MKRRDLIKRLIGAGFVFDRNGSNHDIYIRGTVTESVPRHNEIPEGLVKSILREPLISRLLQNLFCEKANY